MWLVSDRAGRGASPSGAPRGAEPSVVSRAFPACTPAEAVSGVQITAEADGFVPACQKGRSWGGGDARSHHIKGILEMGQLTIDFTVRGHWEEREGGLCEITWARGCVHFPHAFPPSSSRFGSLIHLVRNDSLMPTVSLSFC